MKSVEIPSIMADAINDIVPLVGTDMKERDYLEAIYTNTAMMLFIELEKMGIAGPVEQVDMMMGGSPVYACECLLRPHTPGGEYDYESVTFRANMLNHQWFGIGLFLVDKDGRHGEYISYKINFFGNDAKDDIAGITRDIVMNLQHTEYSIKSIRSWFSGNQDAVEEDEKWIPVDGQSYVYIDESLEVLVAEFSSSNPEDVDRVSNGNCFMDANDALKVIEKARREMK